MHTRTVSRLTLPALAAVAIACQGGERPATADSAGRGVDALPHAAEGPPQPVTAVQLGAFADSATAFGLRDSLAAAGWRVRAAQGESEGRTVWRVRVGASLTAELPELLAHSLRARGREAIVVRDSATPSELAGRMIPVNTGTHGMAARVLWALSPDRRAMIVVEDPAAVEAEPIPNGFVFANEEGGLVVQRDSVWHVSPSADWKRLAWGRSAGAFAREQAGVTDAQWRAMARKIGLPVEVVRRESFSISGMNEAAGVARAAVLDLTPDRDGGLPAARDLPHALGWRVQWMRSGGGLALGAAPRSVQDFSPASSWIVVDPSTGAIRDTLPAAPAPPPRGSGGEPADDRFVHVAWTEGPTLDISVPIDTATEKALAVDGGRILSGGGWIRSQRSGAAARIVGPGTALAATRSGHFVAALAPAPDATEYEAKFQLVVYVVPQ